MGISREIGAAYDPDKGTVFTVWAPEAEQVEVTVTGKKEQTIPMQREAFGYWTALAEEAGPGDRYTYKLNNERSLPDPASQHQPDGVHEASAIVDHHQNRNDDNWQNLPLQEYIIYELHTGTFSEDGTFEGIINKLPELKELGITAIELMPVAQFAGERNWGYDGVYPFAVQHSYGGPEGLKKLVDACHKTGIAVVLDVVYNHLGPEGNYTQEFAPYFTDKYNTPWGAALNFDDAHSDHVRNFFIQNALMWFRDYYIDALRLDAVHAILDTGAKHFLQELQEHVSHLEEQLDRRFYLIAESDLNDVRIINPQEQGGYGLAAQWSDDYHHAIHALVTGEQEGYYHDFGQAEQLLKVLEHGFVYNGLYSEHRKRTFGSDARDNPFQQFVVCSQNHDQVGNRMLGERLTTLVSFEMLKVVAAVVVLGPYVPMLFMGEEYGEKNPFLYFVSHTDKDLLEAVLKGRKEEFKAFSWQGEAPDPQSEETFRKSVLQHSYTSDDQARQLREYYKTLIQIRKQKLIPVNPTRQNFTAELSENKQVLQLSYADKLQVWLNFSNEPQTITTTSNGNLLLNSADKQWAGTQDSDKAYTSGTATLQPESVLVLEV